MMRHALSGRGLVNAWLDAGGKATLESYGGSLDVIPTEQIRLLVSTAKFYQTKTELFIRASLEPALSLANQTSD